jgi:hypothetical protein
MTTKMKIDGGKKYYFEMIDDVKKKLSSLSTSGFIKSSFENENILEKVNNSINNKSLDELKRGSWSPLFLFVNRHSLDELRAFEDDIALIVKHSEQNVMKSLKANITKDNDRIWSGVIFEIFIKSQILRKFENVILDFQLENGKNVDSRINDKENYSIECTIFTDSDEDREVYDNFMKDKQKDELATLIRPGKYDSKESKSPSLYYDCLRFYAKIYDKIAPILNPQNSQLLRNTKNILLISVDAPRSPLRYSPGIGWALDELFADQPRGSFSPQGIKNISLQAWVEFTANKLIRENKICVNRYSENYTQIVQAPKHIGAIMLFNRCSLIHSRVNYNAYDNCRLSHQEISFFEDFLKKAPVWR